MNLEFRALQCLKCGGLWSSLGIARFRCLHSSLMRAIRCANSEHSALNAGVPTDPHSPESNSSYLVLIWSIRGLYSLCASYLVNDWNIKEIFPPKTGRWEKQLLQDPGCVGVVGEMCAALLHACRIFVVVVGDIREGSNYILYYNLNYLN